MASTSMCIALLDVMVIIPLITSMAVIAVTAIMDVRAILEMLSIIPNMDMLITAAEARTDVMATLAVMNTFLL